MLAIAFSADGVLAPTASLHEAAGPQPARDLLPYVQELVRPFSGTPIVLRELEGLGISMAMLGAGPEWLQRRIAQVLWFKGEVVAASGPQRFATLCERLRLPAICVWYVTASRDDAAEALAAGTNVILIDDNQPAALLEPDGDGCFVARSIEDVLEVIRIPYTRSALNLRYIVRKLLDTPSLDELVR